MELRDKPLSMSPLELFTIRGALHCVILHPFCKLSDYNAVGTALGLILTEYPGNWFWYLSDVVFTRS